MTSMVSSSSSIAGNSSRLPTRDDALSLTSFNPFAEEDENDQSSYTLVASLFSRVKNSISAATTSGSQPSTTTPNAQTNGPSVHSPSVTSPKQPSVKIHDKRPPLTPRLGTHASSRSIDKTSGKFSISNKPAQPLVSLTPVVSELPSVNTNPPNPDYYDGAMTPNQSSSPYAFHDTPDSHNYATSIPGFPIPDDARSIRTTMSLKRSASVSKIMRRIRGEGMGGIMFENG
jgi:1-phosphatidylinositol-3-phosphate 5-kinase